MLTKKNNFSNHLLGIPPLMVPESLNVLRKKKKRISPFLESQQSIHEVCPNLGKLEKVTVID